MMKVAVLDDSPADVRIILGMLDDLSSRIVRPFPVQAFTDPFALLDAVQEKGGFDLYFLDIIMPVMSGMEVASRIRSRGETCEIIFLTTSREYGVEAFGVNAAGYLLKPIDRARLEGVVMTAVARLDVPGGKSIVVRTGGGVQYCARHQREAEAGTGRSCLRLSQSYAGRICGRNAAPVQRGGRFSNARRAGKIAHAAPADRSAAA